MSVHTVRKIMLVCGVCLVLAACDSAEERAEAYFQSAQELIESGDLDRAVIELRNVFELAPHHVEARQTMARLMVERGNTAGAYNQYLKLVELRPDDVEARATLAEIAFDARNWEEFARHGERALELAPEAPRSAAIDLALQYRSAILADDVPARDAVTARVEEMKTDLPESSLLEQILLDSYMRAGTPEKALAQLDEMIARNPDARRLYDQRLFLLQQVGDRPAVEEHLRNVVAQFPEDIDAKSALVQYLIVTDAHDQAEAFLREISDPADPDQTFFISLVQFLKEVRGIDVARAELDAALDVNPEPDRLRMIRAAMDFEAGQREAAIADLQAIIDGAEPSDLTNDIKITLARMLISTGNEVGAQRLVDEVLEADSGNVAALKMSAAWLIEADDTDAAIANLRRALDSAPDDAQALSLMADAHTRTGSHDLARDFLAQAVDVSGNAPIPSLRYARLLLEDESYLSAEGILLSALRRAPTNTAILTMLGEMYLAMEDFGRASMAVEQLRRIETEEAAAAANQLQVQLLSRKEGTEEALGFIEEMAKSAEAGLSERILLLRARLSSGQRDMALSLAEELVAEDPENPQLRFLLAVTRSAIGESDAAKEDLRALLEEDPKRLDVWQQLYRILRTEGDTKAASAVLGEALTALPEAPVLLWARAGELETAGKVDEAIAIYDGLYARNTNSVVFANNLASLLVTYKEDDASLDRAWAIARRLRDTDVPAFQDTYGWLAFRRGDAETALSYLESAADGLPQDAIVQYHLAEVYAALDRPQDAIAAYQRALDVAGADDTRPQIERAREELARLQQAGTAAENQ